MKDKARVRGNGNEARRSAAAVSAEAAGSRRRGEEELDPAFERVYEQMMERAIAESRGERKRRLQDLRTNGHAEKMLAARVLWPALGSLEHVHPEVEIRDLRGGVNFVDYIYKPTRYFALLLECDGFGPHWRDISRWDFDRSEERQNLLLLDEWRMLRFSYDGVMEKSQRCQQTVLLALAKWGQATAVGAGKDVKLSVYERAILHYGMTYDGEVLKPSLVARELGTNRHTVTKYMRVLEEKGLLSPVYSSKGKIMGYVLTIPGLKR